jgi:hypothetical protein
MQVSLNIAIYLAKYFKKKGSIAERLAYYGIYALYKEKLGSIVNSSKHISEGDVLDLVVLRTDFKIDETVEMPL